MKPKSRLDVLLTERGLAESRSRAQALIMAGKVRVDGEILTKPGHGVSHESTLTLDGEDLHVSRGYLKLAHGLDAFTVRPEGRVCLDIGASTGGFTQCLLDLGARHVYAVDSGTNQLHERLRRDPRVTVMEKTNARHLGPEAFATRPDFAVMDVSFISTLKIMPALRAILPPPGTLVTLVKPQFEAEPSEISRGGRVLGLGLHREVLGRWTAGVLELGALILGCCASPIQGTKSGNVEYLAQVHLHPGTADKPGAVPCFEGVLRELERAGLLEREDGPSSPASGD